MKKRILTVLLAVCLVVALGTVTAAADDDVIEVATADDLKSALSSGGDIRLSSDIDATSITLEVESGITATIDLNGKTLTIDEPINVNGVMYVEDNTAITEPSVDMNDNYKVTYQAGSIHNTYGTRGNNAVVITVRNGGKFVHNSGILKSEKNYTIGIYGEARVSDWETPVNSEAIINGGYQVGPEGGPGVFGNGATLTITGGVLEGTDNAVVAGNGTLNNTNNFGGYTINIEGGTLIGRITSSGYISCVVYHPNVGILNISGGTLISTNGVGVLSRAGTSNITGGTIIAEGDRTTTGKVGDAGNPVGIYGVIYDLLPSYPGHENVDAIYISGTANITGAAGAVDVIEETEESDPSYDEIVITGGSFSGDIGNYIPDGAALTQDANGNVVETEDESNPIVARVESVPFADLAPAIAYANDNGGIITLEGDVNLGTITESTDKIEIPANADITIDGRGYKITAVYSGTRTSDDSSANQAIITLGKDSELTLNNVKLDFSSEVSTNGSGLMSGDGFLLNSGSSLTFGDNTIADFHDLHRVFVFMGNTPKLNVNDSTLNIYDIEANASNGGEWTIENNSSVNYGNIGNNALSAWVLTVDNSYVYVDGAGYLGVVSHNMTLTKGAYVSVTNSAYSNSIPTDFKGTGAVSLWSNSGAELTIDNSTLILSGNGNASSGGDKDLYVGAVTPTLNGDYTVAAKFITTNGGIDGFYTVMYLNNGRLFDSKIVTASTDTTHKVISTQPIQNGYEFRGWRSDADNKIYTAGDSFTVTKDVILTAIWNAINVPDTYDIDLIVSDGGEAKTNLSNASTGTTITVTATPDEGYELDYITVDGERISGTSFKMPAHDVTVRVYFTDGTSTLPFTDVRPNQWFYDAISYVYTNGMMEGDSATTFNPDGQMTRAMFWAVLGRIDGANITGANWVDTARNWAMSKGVSDGTDPNGLVTREMMVTMLWRYAGEPESDYSLSAYTDANSVSDWAAEAMAWAVENGVISGVSATTLAPQGTATRAQCATIFMRYDADIA